jgi:methylenetetrahydrofolate reductase (NADPH)
MKIIDKIHDEVASQEKASEGAKLPFFSFEFFPPKTEAGTENLYLRMERMTNLRPIFVDITWGSGGSTKDLTMAISEYTQTYFGTEALMHLTCTGLTRDEIKGILLAARNAGIQNILALRGDPPKGALKWTPIPDGLNHAIDLVKLIREEHGNYFCIGVAGFPEGHPHSEGFRTPQNTPSKDNGNSNSDSTNNNDRQNVYSMQEIDYLKEKIDAGADFVLTQFFYDAQVFLDFVDACRSKAIDVPIIPGMMPIQGYSSFEKMTKFCRTRVPASVWESLAQIKANDEEVKSYGVQLCVDMCKALWQAGVPGFHFYTLNLEKSVSMILEGLNILENTASRRALPWRGSRLKLSQTPDTSSPTSGMNSPIRSNNSLLASSSNVSSTDLENRGRSSSDARKMEDVRPINWANRTKSYIKRTITWDEFPNGRWGDSRSAAFGELSDSHFFRPVEGCKEDRLAMWGEAPIKYDEVYEVFAKYVEGKIPILPWCESEMQEETRVISEPLAAFNRAGFLTINSQPVVNGEKSDHPVFGWGGKGGRVYQKAYIEFFASPELLNIVMNDVASKPNLNLYAVNSSGHRINNGPKGVTALTWGVFPGKEILQPTVFDYETFLVWSEEAFRLWTNAWAILYEDETESAGLIYDIYENFFLVAVIDDEYIDSQLYPVTTNFWKTKVEEHIAEKEAKKQNDAASDEENVF